MLKSIFFSAVAIFPFVATQSHAASLTYGAFVSSNGPDMLSPAVTVNDNMAGFFEITVSHNGSSDGHLNLIAFDLGSAVVGASDISGVNNDGTAISYNSSCNNTNNQVSTGEYCFGTTVPVGGNSNDLNPFPTVDFDFALAFFNNDAIADNGSTLTFLVSDQGGTIALTDFAKVGLRYQSANNNAGSDKLIGLPFPDGTIVGEVPLPAAGWMLIAALGGIGAMKRRKSA